MALQTIFLTGAILCFAITILGLVGSWIPLLFLPNRQHEHSGHARAFQKSILIPLHQSADAIEAKLENLFHQLSADDEIIIALDGHVSNIPQFDATPVTVTVLSLPRCGKNAALNAAAAKAKNEILIILDRDGLCDQHAIQNISDTFVNDSVGAACGFIQIASADSASKGQRTYWSHENKLKYAESLTFGNITAANGSLLAIRRSDFMPIPDGYCDDLYIALLMRQTKKLCLFVPSAKVVVPPRRKNIYDVFARQRRITIQSIATLHHFAGLLSPFRHGAFAWTLLCHKVLRRIAPLALWLGCTFLLAIGSFWYAIVYLLCCGIAGFALRSTRNNAHYVPFAEHKIGWFVAAVLGMTCGVIEGLSGKKITIWE